MYKASGGLVIEHMSLAKIRKTQKLTNEQVRELLPTLIHSDLTGGYYTSRKGYVSSLALTKGLSDEDKEAEYDRIIRPSTKCRLPGCNNTVPYGMTALGACCDNHYRAAIRIAKGAASIEDYTFRCELCGAVFSRIDNLSRHLSGDHHYTAEQSEAYYNTYMRKPEDPDGKCKWCGAQLKFVSIGVGYREFCGSTCSVLWHNKYEDRAVRAGETSHVVMSAGDVQTSQLGYWLKKGYSEDEAREKLRERQTTNSVDAIAKRKGVSIEEATEIRKEITKKWLASRTTGLSYSKVSQELFWAVWENIKTEFSPTDVFFATFDAGVRTPSSSKGNKEYRIDTSTSCRYADFFIKSLNISIEFDGTWHHSNNGWRPSDFDTERDAEIMQALPGHKILHVPETEYRKNKAAVVSKCVKFILKAQVLREIQQEQDAAD